MIKRKFADENGITRLTYTPSEYDKPEMGIPCDVFNILDEYFVEVPDEFRIRLYTRLSAMGLVEPSDYLQKGAKIKVRQALQHAIGSDSTDIIRFIVGTIED